MNRRRRRSSAFHARDTMNTMTVDEVYESIVRPMPPVEQERLAAKIAACLAQRKPIQEGQNRTITPAIEVSLNGFDWNELRGIMPYPICGEDAQAWVSRTRREGDEHRAYPLRKSS